LLNPQDTLKRSDKPNGDDDESYFHDESTAASKAGRLLDTIDGLSASANVYYNSFGNIQKHLNGSTSAIQRAQDIITSTCTQNLSNAEMDDALFEKKNGRFDKMLKG
jgi:hypothetical protein